MLKRTLRTITQGDHPDQKWHQLNITRYQERLLRVLLIREHATYQALYAALYWDNDEPDDPEAALHVQMSNIRRRLPFLRPWLKCVFGRGYALSPEGKHRLLFELKNPGVASGGSNEMVAVAS